MKLPLERSPETHPPRQREEAASIELGPASVLALQRSAGNLAVGSLMEESNAAMRAAGSAKRPPLALKADVALQRELARVVHGRRQLQRAVKTSGGEWSTDTFNLLKDEDAQGTKYPPAAGVRGADIVVRFKPDTTVDAELIGLSQSVLAFVAGAPSMTPSQAAVAIPSADAETVNTGPGETDETAAIDNLEGYNSPLYATKAATSASLADPSTEPQWGQHGWHYTDATKTVKHQDALLKDTPMRDKAQTDSRHIFETTALATKGNQRDTYYGSVRWGWRTDAKGTFTKIDLEKVSDGVPSSTFMKAAELWNAGKSTTGADNLDLPTVDVKVTTAPVTLVLPVPMLDIVLPAGTRLRVIREWVAPLLTGTVKVVDGPHTGETGEVDPADWPSIVDERA